MKNRNSSSVLKGNKFEDRVFKVFSDELNNNRLYFNPNFCKIKKKGEYYSKDRQKNIIVDVSIEIFLPNQTEWSQLLVIECKNYNKLVPVDDVEEFSSKLQQIAGGGIKGVVVTSQGFQKGALNYARSKNIGLVKLNNVKDFTWILKRVAPSISNIDDLEKINNQINFALTSEFQIEKNVEFYANIRDTFTTSVYDFIKHLYIDFDSEQLSVTNQDVNNECFVKFVSREYIEKLAKKINEEIGFDKSEYSIVANCKKIKKLYGIKFKLKDKIELNDLRFVVLGKIEFDPDLITLFTGVQNNKFRLKFTLAHELGHYFLKHKSYLIKEIYSEQDYETNDGEKISVMDISRMELQANQFASSFLLPEKQFLKEFYKLLKQENINDKGYGKLYIDNQKCNLDSFYKITNLLRDNFRVSRRVIEYRLKNLGLLTDDRGKQTKNLQELF